MSSVLKIDEKFTTPVDGVTIKVEHANYAPLIRYDLPGPRGAERAVAITLPPDWRRYGVAHPGNELRVVGLATYDGAKPPAGKRELGDEQWFGFSVMVPGETALIGTNITLCQWHGGAAHTEPHFALRLQHTGRFRLLLRTGASGLTFDGPAAEHNRWYDVVINAKWASSPTGFVSAWIDGEPLAAFTGATVRNPPTSRTTYLKFGLYIPDWRSADGHQPKTLHFASVRLAGADGDRAAVDPNRDKPGLSAEAVAALVAWLQRGASERERWAATEAAWLAEGRALMGVGSW